MKIQHIYWFAPFNLTCPSTRYRGKYPLEYFANHCEISSDFIMPNWKWRGILIFLKIYIEILFFRKANSVVVIQKIVSNRFYANALKFLVLMQKGKTLYDLDDAEYIRTDPNTLHFFLKHCQVVSVGSELLKEYCSEFNPNVFLQTSPVLAHNCIKKNKNEVLTIGWVGDFGNGNELSKSFSHKTSLYTLFFNQLRTLSFPIKLCLIGIKNPSDIPEIKRYFLDCLHIELEIPENLNWAADLWLYEKITNWDIGVSPILSHPFTEAKSAFKAKQCLSCGVPVLASPVGENEEFVTDAQNGFICRKGEDFSSKISFFQTMSNEDYDLFCQNARTSSDSFSISKYCTTIIDYFSEK